MLPETEAGIPLLLQAHAARGRGNAVDTDHAFQALLKNADTALLGVQGLIQKSVIEAILHMPCSWRAMRGQLNRTITHCLNLFMILKFAISYGRMLCKRWNRAVSKKIIAKDVANNDRIAIYCLLGDKEKVAGKRDDALTYYKKAVSLAPSFAPAVDRLARHYFENRSP